MRAERMRVSCDTSSNQILAVNFQQTVLIPIDAAKTNLPHRKFSQRKLHGDLSLESMGIAQLNPSYDSGTIGTFGTSGTLLTY